MSIRGILASAVTGDVPGRLWGDCFYQRSLNLIAGPSKVGKSQVSVSVVADIAAKDQVIYCNAEDDEVVQALRFRAVDANLDNIHLASFTIPDDLDALRSNILTLGAKLVVFDTAEKHIHAPVQHWGKHLAKLRYMLAETDCAVMYISHTLKNVKKSADWRAAIAGNVGGMVGSCRYAALVGRPTGGTDPLFIPVADQYGADPVGQPTAIRFEFDSENFTMSDGRDVPISYVSPVEYGITVSNPADAVFIAGDDRQHGPNPEALAAATRFVTEALTAGPRCRKDTWRCLVNPDGASGKCGQIGYNAGKDGACPDCGGPLVSVSGLQAEGELHDLSWGTLRRAITNIECESRKAKNGTKAFAYYVLPDGHHHATAENRREIR